MRQRKGGSPRPPAPRSRPHPARFPPASNHIVYNCIIFCRSEIFWIAPDRAGLQSGGGFATVCRIGTGRPNALRAGAGGLTRRTCHRVLLFCWKAWFMHLPAPSPAPAGSASHPAALPVERLLADCEVDRTRRSGPGGQHRNKVETAIVLVHRPSGIRAEAGERRSQPQNHAVAVFRLRVKLALCVRLPLGDTWQPSPLWRSRCRNQRVAVNTDHADFPAILAEALDVVYFCELDLKQAASRLACTPTQLAKLMQQEPNCWQAFNAARTKQGLPGLK